MANRCGQRVARVHGPIGLHAEHPPDHETDLLLVGPADAHQRFFDHRGFVVPHRQIIGRTGRNGRTASLTELERGRRVLGGKNLFHGRFVRFQTTEHPMHFLKDDPEPGSELSVKRRADDPAIHKLEHAGHFAHHSPPRIPGTGIDADDGDGLRHEKKEGRDFRAPNGSTARRRGPHTLPGERLLEHSALKGTEGRW